MTDFEYSNRVFTLPIVYINGASKLSAGQAYIMSVHSNKRQGKFVQYKSIILCNYSVCSYTFIYLETSQ